MQRLWIVVRLAVCAGFGVGAWVTQTSPDEAVEKACKWFLLYGKKCPHWIDAANIPRWTPIALSVLAALVLLWVLWPWIAKKLRDTSMTPKTPEDQTESQTIGEESVVMGNVPTNLRVGNRSVVVGPTDNHGNTILNTPMAVGYRAYAGPGSISIGAHAGSAGAPAKKDDNEK